MRLPAPLAAALLLLIGKAFPCCAVSRRPVVNADQSVIMIWDEAQKTQHFIRQANFRTDAPDVGFIVPSPSRPTLSKSGTGAFAELESITAPPVSGGGFSFGCSAAPKEMAYGRAVRVIEEKRVAGYDATVLTADSGEALVTWLKAHGYSYSPEVAEWARPYLGGGWHFTALKVAKDGGASEIKASSLRISFRAERPLFPYREPASAAAARELGAPQRLLRIFFISDARYRAEIAGRTWSGKVVWSGDITRFRSSLLADLGNPENTPATWWLTEFEDRWPYAQAAGDVYFHRDTNQRAVRRGELAGQATHDLALLACLTAGLVQPLRRRRCPTPASL